MFTRGGRGGKVLEVTTLFDTTATNVVGTLRWAVNQSGARTVVFRVSGTIVLKAPLKITKDSITVAGQTAPGDGICLSNYTFNVSANQVIIRFIRCRFGDLGTTIDDALNGYSSTPRNKKNIIIDHCSASWGIDETLSFYGYDSSTVQWCIISESLYNNKDPKGAHGYGGIWGGFNTTFHHNLLANHSSRNPRFSGPTPAGSGTAYSDNLDFRNNVIYNWGFNSSYGGEESDINIVNNYYKYGPATRPNVMNRLFNPYGSGDSTGMFYIEGNYMDGDTAVTNDNWKGVVPEYSGFRMDSAKALSPFPFPPVTTDSPQQAYDRVLAGAGATLPTRDTIDRRIVYEVANRTATYSGHTHAYEEKYGLDTTVPHGMIDSQTDVGGWPLLNSSPAPADSDHDGMPDDWELAHGLNPYDASDRNIVDASGYTKLEEYLDEIAGTPTSVVAVPGAVPNKFEVFQNYPNPFNPSTEIGYRISKVSTVMLNVYDVLGRAVATLVNERKPPGMYNVVFDGSKLASGVYFYRVQAGTSVETKRMILMK
ncbi:MAG: T9SS type A sorting domain-containing protein [Bacteroidota bacterium]|nr:T9SS type A sorting domain-containing protein [Bacteroidota bacterium]